MYLQSTGREVGPSYVQALVLREAHIKIVDLIKPHINLKGLNFKKIFREGGPRFLQNKFSILRHFPKEYCGVGLQLRTDMKSATPLLRVTLRPLHSDTPQGTLCALVVLLQLFTNAKITGDYFFKIIFYIKSITIKKISGQIYGSVRSPYKIRHSSMTHFDVEAAIKLLHSI